MDPYGLDEYAQGPLQQPGTVGAAPRGGGFLARLNGAFEPFGGLGNVGLQILANSNSGQGTGAILAQSLLQGQQQQQQQKDQELRRRYLQSQIAALNTKDTSPIVLGKGGKLIERGSNRVLAENPDVSEDAPVAIIGPDGKPQFVTRAEAIGKVPYEKRGDVPSNVQEWQYYSQLSQADQRRYLEMRRQQNSFVKDVGGVPTVILPSGTLGTLTQPLSTLPREAAAKGTLAEAGAAGEKTGSTVAGNQLDFPRIEQNTNQALDTVAQLVNHPGLPYITGMMSKIPIIPGTKQAAADALDRQVHGQTFLQAYQALRGGGQISDVEGAKAEGALARASRAQSTDDYKAAMNEFAGYLRKGLDRARQQARLGIAPTPPADVGGNTGTPAVRKWNPATGQLE